MWHVCFCVLSDLSVSLSSKMPRWDPEDDATTDSGMNIMQFPGAPCLMTRLAICLAGKYMASWWSCMECTYGMYLWNVLHVLLISCLFFWFAVMFAHVCCIQCHVHWDYFCRNFGRCRLFAEDIPLSLASLVLLEQTFYGCNSALWVSTLWDPRKMACCLFCFPHSLETQFLIHP